MQHSLPAAGVLGLPGSQLPACTGMSAATPASDVSVAWLLAQCGLHSTAQQSKAEPATLRCFAHALSCTDVGVDAIRRGGPIPSVQMIRPGAARKAMATCHMLGVARMAAKRCAAAAAPVKVAIELAMWRGCCMVAAVHCCWSQYWPTLGGWCACSSIPDKLK